MILKKVEGESDIELSGDEEKESRAGFKIWSFIK